ncbi:MAG TPA: hypothetical protein VEW42_05310 [Candidatus Eisenbacteria bacterium]|nr:hypothetical protein [Candidatus Eisenbacteria bacterium]
MVEQESEQLKPGTLYALKVPLTDNKGAPILGSDGKPLGYRYNIRRVVEIPVMGRPTRKNMGQGPQG